VNSPIFNALIMLIILLNTLVLSLDKYPEFEGDTAEVLGVVNTVFTIIFTLEVVLKLLGLGVRGYAADKFNLFDALIVVISIAEMFAAEGGPLSALRAFRLFRIFKIFRAGDLRTLLDSIAFTVVTIKDYTILLALFIYVFALLGMSFFAGKARFDEDGAVDIVNGVSPRINFDNTKWAALTVFEVMIGENWNAVMYDHMRALGDGACVYFIALVVLGNIIMLNLFLAILLGNFDRARSFGEKKKIFDNFGQLLKAGYKLTLAITYLFDDAEFARYIDEKVLKAGSEEKNKSKPETSLELEHKALQEHEEHEIQHVSACLQDGAIEEILTGEQVVGIFEGEAFTGKRELSAVEREKTKEVLTYVKKQSALRK
jgi:hypothetical protein